MTTPDEHLATPSDEMLLDAIAEDHVSHMSLLARQRASRADAKDRREPVDLPASDETPDDFPDAGPGAFESVLEPPKKSTTPILVDLPLHVSAVDAADQPDEENSAYQATAEPEKNLAEEILSQQMSDETELDAPGVFESEPILEEDKSPPQVEEPIEMIAQSVSSATPAVVRPRPMIGAIRPPAQPSRFRSILIQTLIVLLALTAVGMVAYLMGLL